MANYDYAPWANMFNPSNLILAVLARTMSEQKAEEDRLKGEQSIRDLQTALQPTPAPTVLPMSPRGVPGIGFPSGPPVQPELDSPQVIGALSKVAPSSIPSFLINAAQERRLSQVQPPPPKPREENLNQWIADLNNLNLSEAERKTAQSKIDTYRSTQATMTGEKSKATQGNFSLGGDALDVAASTYLTTGQLPPMGMGVSGAKMRIQILERAASLNKERGGELNQPAINKALYDANKSALTQFTKINTALNAFSKTAEDNMQLALDQSKLVRRTGSPIVNRYMQWANGQTLTGNPELTKFETYIYTAAREYAKVTMGASASIAALTDTAAKETSKLLNAAQTPEAFAAAITAMKNDMANVRANFNLQQKEIEGRLGNNEGGSGKKTIWD